MHFPRFPLLLVLCLLAALLKTSLAWGQAATGKVFGTVTDQQHAVVPEAKVIVTNEATQVSNTATTNHEGYFEVLDLPIGAYTVTVEREGFTKYVTHGNKLQINESLKFEISLKVGMTTQTVTVEAQATQVETVNPTLGQSVTSRQLVNLPLNGRDVLSLALLQPGVTEADPDYSGAGSTSQSGGFSVAGGRPDSITYLLDGGLNNNLLDNGVVFNPNPDSIAEFRILTSDYTAEYGRNASGIISVVTKSGTNDLHGSAFEFARNGAVNANSYFNNLNRVPRDNLKRHQFGGTLGGPITIPHLVNGRDRFFFFVAYQGQRLSQALVSPNTPAFTPQEISGDFSAAGVDPISGASIPDPGVRCFLAGQSSLESDGVTPLDPCTDPNTGAPLPAHPFFAKFPGSSDPAQQAMIDPTKINPIAARYIAKGWIPVSASGLISPTGRHEDNNNELTGKLDFIATPKDKIEFTVGGFRNRILDPFNFADVPGFPNSTVNDDYFSNVGYTRTFSATLLNEFRFTAQRVYRLHDATAATLPTPADLGVGVTPDLPTGPSNIAFDTGLTLGFSEQGPAAFASTTYSLADTVILIRGHHTWKWGGGFSVYQNNTHYDFAGNGEFDFNGSGGVGTGYGAPSPDPTASFGNSFADFLLGIPANLFLQGPNARNNIRSKATYGFVQDEWRVRSNLTLTLGLRYEYYTPKLDSEGRTFTILPGRQSTVFTQAPVGLVFPGDRGAPRGLNFPDEDNFAPRIGIAWDPWNNGKTSVRGGFGIYYDVLNGVDNLQFNGATPFYADGFAPFGPVAGNQASPVAYLSDPWVSSKLPNPFPSKPPTQNLDFATAGFLPFNNVGALYFVNPHLYTPYTYQYNLSVQRELAPNLVAEVNYVGNASKGLTALRDVNPIVLGTFDRALNLTPQPNVGIQTFCGGLSSQVLPGEPVDSECPFATAPEFSNVAFANYNSLEASLTRQVASSRFFGTSYFTLAYTYGHSIDTASGFRNRNSFVAPYNINQFRASSDSDIKHRITLSGGWDLPFERAWSSGPKRLTKGWSLYPIFSWRTGFPLDVPANFSFAFNPWLPGPSGAGDPYALNALFAPGVTRVETMDPHKAGNLYFSPSDFTNGQFSETTPCSQQVTKNEFPSNACAVAVPALRTYGLPRNFFRGPGRANLDLAVAKTTPITERLNAEFRVEAFNLPNRAEFQNPTTNIFSPSFGQVTTSYDPRIVQLALRLTF